MSPKKIDSPIGPSNGHGNRQLPTADEEPPRRPARRAAAPIHRAAASPAEPPCAAGPPRLSPGRHAAPCRAACQAAEEENGRGAAAEEPPHRAARQLATSSRQASLGGVARRRPAGPPRRIVPSCLPGCRGERKTRRRCGGTVASSHLPGSRAESPDLPRRRDPVARPWSCAGGGCRAWAAARAPSLGQLLET